VLFAIRPIRREAIIWAKFVAVFACVAIACVVSIAAGVAVDAIRGTPPTGAMLHELGKTLVSLVGVIALSCGVGVVMGVILALDPRRRDPDSCTSARISRFIPMIPVYFHILPEPVLGVHGESASCSRPCSCGAAA